MTDAELEALCEVARKRLAVFVNRSAAQHLRAMRKEWAKCHE